MDVDGFVVEVEDGFKGEVDGFGGPTSLRLAKLAGS